MFELLKTFKNKMGQQADAAKTEYRQIIGRYNKPKAEDADRLQSLMFVLGYDAATVEAHIDAIAQAEALATQADNFDGLAMDVKALKLEYAKAREDHNEAVAKGMKLLADKDAAIRSKQHEMSVAGQAQTDLERLKQKYPELFS